MTVERLITADMPNALGEFSTQTSVAVSTAQARTGSKSFLLNNNADTFTIAMTAAASKYYRLCLFIETAGSVNPAFLISAQEGATVHVQVVWDSSTGKLSARRGTTTLGTGTAVLNTNTWYCIEVYYSIHDSTGAVTVKVNGTTDIALTNQDTKNAGTTGQPDNLKITLGSTINVAYYIDDGCISDAWPGQHGIYVLLPTGAGSNAAWAASAGNAFDCVNDDDFTDYISDDTISDKHDFALADLPITPDALGAVQAVAVAKLNSAGSGNVRVYIDSGGTAGNGADTALSTSAQNVRAVFALDPNGSVAWAAAAINALKLGIESRP